MTQKQSSQFFTKVDSKSYTPFTLSGLPDSVRQLDVHVVRLVPAVLPADGAQLFRRFLHSGDNLIIS